MGLELAPKAFKFDFPDTTWKIILEFCSSVFIKTRNAVLTEKKTANNVQVDLDRSTLADMMVQYHTGTGRSMRGSCNQRIC